MDYVAPEESKDAFHCPHSNCGSFSHQNWCSLYVNALGGGFSGVEGFNLVKCQRCDQWSVWHNGKILFPGSYSAPAPNPDLPDDCKVDFEEARAILSKSPRGAGALLRLCIEKLCNHLLGEEMKPNAAIGELVKRGLNPKIQRSLDSVRVIGNEAVHPGVMDLSDDPETVGKLFKLVNIITETMITHEKEVDEIYGLLPPEKRNGIENRDS